MVARFKFVGQLEQIAETSETQIPLQDKVGWDGIMRLFKPNVSYALMDDRVRVFHNGEALADKRDMTMVNGDEVAFLQI